MLPSPSDFGTFLVALTQKAGEFEKESMLRGLTLWKTWAHFPMEGGGRADHRWTRVDLAQHCIENMVRQGETFSDPVHIIDDEMDVWNELWQRHDKISQFLMALSGSPWQFLRAMIFAVFCVTSLRVKRRGLTTSLCAWCLVCLTGASPL